MEPFAMYIRARFAAAVLPPLLVMTAACGGTDNGEDDSNAPGVGSAADVATGAPGGGSASGSGIADGTKGYMLVAPETVDAYTKSDSGSAPGKKDAEALGVGNAGVVSGIYHAPSTDPGDPAKVGGTRLHFDGFHGGIADPVRALDHYLATIGDKGLKGTGPAPGIGIRPVGRAETVQLAGIEGALMKCQDMEVTRSKGEEASKGVAEFRFPVCAWVDHSTLGGVRVLGLAQMTNGGEGAPPEEVAALTVRFYDTARQRA